MGLAGVALVLRQLVLRLAAALGLCSEWLWQEGRCPGGQGWTPPGASVLRGLLPRVTAPVGFRLQMGAGGHGLSGAGVGGQCAAGRDWVGLTFWSRRVESVPLQFPTAALGTGAGLCAGYTVPLTALKAWCKTGLAECPEPAVLPARPPREAGSLCPQELRAGPVRGRLCDSVSQNRLWGFGDRRAGGNPAAVT